MLRALRELFREGNFWREYRGNFFEKFSRELLWTRSILKETREATTKRRFCNEADRPLRGFEWDEILNETQMGLNKRLYTRLSTTTDLVRGEVRH